MAAASVQFASQGSTPCRAGLTTLQPNVQSNKTDSLFVEKAQKRSLSRLERRPNRQDFLQLTTPVVKLILELCWWRIVANFRKRVSAETTSAGYCVTEKAGQKVEGILGGAWTG